MIPSMVSHHERLVLRDFLALNYQGGGEIVEIGAFVGSSAIAIMQGIQKSRHPAKLHVYDAFLFPKNDLEPVYRKYLMGMEGDSFRKAFDYVTRAWTDMLIVHEGDAAQAKWSGRPISFMHIDCSVSREFHEAVAKEFYPHLELGAVIAHQDYEYGRAPFIKEIMARLAPWFVTHMKAETTQYFVLKESLTRADIERALAEPARVAA